MYNYETLMAHHKERMDELNKALESLENTIQNYYSPSNDISKNKDVLDKIDEDLDALLND